MAKESRLAASLCIISAARDPAVVERVTRAAVISRDGKNFPQTSVLNVFADHDYNRSVITIVGPLSKLAIARQLADHFHHFSAFLFGAADRPQRRSLLQRRREFGWFTGGLPSPAGMLPDVGPLPNSHHGLTAIGASPYVLNCNVTIDTAQMQVGQRIAASVRASSIGGLPGVQSMALPNKGRIEIACNLLSLPEDCGSAKEVPEDVSTSPACLEARVRELALSEGVSVIGCALVGLTRRQCRALAVKAIAEGIPDYWKLRQVTMM
uniref:formiminotransferase N-terminal subdomain-containing protein isoform X2 n=1 Tax=Myxine glutinosa TaxID=7769 RepID=UPI00358F69A8